MHKILRVAKFLVLSVVALLLIAVGALLALRVHRQHVTARAIAIRAPNGIDEGKYIKIEGIDQWIQIRGQTAIIRFFCVFTAGREVPGSLKPWSFFRGKKNSP
jgi:hypothetical protein